LPERPEKVADLSSEELEGLNEVIYVHPANGASYSLNMTAASILEWCDGQRNRQEIAGLLADALPTDTRPDMPTLLADVDATISSFVDCGLVYAGPEDNG